MKKKPPLSRESITFIANEFLERSRRIEVSTAYRRGWRLFSMETGPLLGCVFLFCGLLVLLVSAGLVADYVVWSAVIGEGSARFFHPVSVLLLLCAGGVLGGGMKLLFVERARYFMSPLSTLFYGFQRGGLSLAIVTLIHVAGVALAFAGVLFGGVLRAAWVVYSMGWLPVSGEAGLAKLAAKSPVVAQVLGVGYELCAASQESALIGVGLGVACVAGIAAFVYFETVWKFAAHLIIDRHLGALKALEVSRRVVSEQWFRVALIGVCNFAVLAGGVLCLGFGVFFAATLVIAVNARLYCDLFGNEETRSKS